MNMQEFISRLGVVFTDEEKRECAPTIDEMVRLSNIARQYGVLALDKEAEECKSFFQKTGMELIVDGTDPEMVKGILQHLILADKYTGADLLNRLLMTEGILAMQMGMNPRTMACYLGAMLGEKFLPEIVKNHTPNFDKPYTPPLPHDKVTWPESANFEKKLSELTLPGAYWGLTVLTAETDRQTLALALCGCSAELIYNTRGGVSEKTFAEICENIISHENWGKEHALPSVQNAQAKVLENLTELKRTGRILEFDDNGNVIPPENNGWVFSWGIEQTAREG